MRPSPEGVKLYSIESVNLLTSIDPFKCQKSHLITLKTHDKNAFQC
ncbi:hypothetical protein E2C01_068551 [Portunus trituberculatus]|uniref:Uncharacterized protein n=1 Tax=Portunus trituberculatus TaxID=210409 RepID=A0A5B7HWR5_PORTR|nr:hypothetical protein [Portunus trituberculatus]